jgi:hypothetical protein
MNDLPQIIIDNPNYYFNLIELRVDKTSNSPCWLINCDSDYPKLKINYVSYRIHRIMYYCHYKIDPVNLLVCHNCQPNTDNPLCVNPKHLWLGTDSDNLYDSYAKGDKPHCKKIIPDADIQEIRRLKFEENWTHKQLIEEFGYSKSMISYIVNYKTRIND